MSSLQSRLLAAHDAADHRALVGLYSEAAERAADTDAACFFLTHAYVFALEVGDLRSAELHGRLKEKGRES